MWPPSLSYPPADPPNGVWSGASAFSLPWLLSGIATMIALLRGEQEVKPKPVWLLPGSMFEQRRRLRQLPNEDPTLLTPSLPLLCASGCLLRWASIRVTSSFPPCHLVSAHPWSCLLSEAVPNVP